MCFGSGVWRFALKILSFGFRDCSFEFEFENLEYGISSLVFWDWDFKFEFGV